MSAEIAGGTVRKKHRHDLGQEDHGPKLAAGTTKAIQALLGLWIAGTFVLILLALIDGTRAPYVGAIGAPPPTSATAPTE